MAKVVIGALLACQGGLLVTASGLTDNPIAVSGTLTRLDSPSVAWTAQLVQGPKHTCTFQQNTDVKGAGDGTVVNSVKDAQTCCDLCQTAAATAAVTGAEPCVAATFCEVGSGCDNECWLKTQAEVSGGTYSRAKRIACQRQNDSQQNTALAATFDDIATQSKVVLELSQPAVPGDLITDLERAGLIGDPLYELNFRNATLWDTPVSSGKQWVYSTTFSTETVTGESHTNTINGNRPIVCTTCSNSPVYKSAPSYNL